MKAASKDVLRPSVATQLSSQSIGGGTARWPRDRTLP